MGLAEAAGAQLVPLSRYDYFLQHRPAAREGHGNITKHRAFCDGNELLHELRGVFDWIAEEQGAVRISLRRFNLRLPEINRIFPALATSFADMDGNGDCWLDYAEFVQFCLNDERLGKKLKRSNKITVYGLDADSRRTYKDPVDIDNMCEMSVPPPLLPWEVAHVVEWKIDGYKPGSGGIPTTLAGTKVDAGMSVASHPFRAAGVCGYLRFWPVSFYRATQLRKRSAMPPVVDDTCTGRSFEPPATNSWCCLGACFDENVHLHIRFFAASQRSEVRTYFWSRALNTRQVWSPPGPYEPSDGPLIVGIEISRNLNMQHDRPLVKRMNREQRALVRPSLNQPAKPCTSVLLGRKPGLPPISASASAPSLLSTTESKSVASWPSLQNSVRLRTGEKFIIKC